MKYKQAQNLLKKAIHEQKTIQTSKLKEIVMALGISLKNDEQKEDPELLVLRNALKQRNMEIKELKVKVKNQSKMLKILDGKQKGGTSVGGNRKEDQLHQTT